MKINITDKNADRIKALLALVEQHSSARLLTLERILEILAAAEAHMGIPKTKMAGVTIHYTGAEKVPHTYNLSRCSTQFSATHNGHNWVLWQVCRANCPNSQNQATLDLSDTAKQAVLERFCQMSNI